MAKTKNNSAEWQKAATILVGVRNSIKVFDLESEAHAALAAVKEGEPISFEETRFFLELLGRAGITEVSGEDVYLYPDKIQDLRVPVSCDEAEPLVFPVLFRVDTEKDFSRRALPVFKSGTLQVYRFDLKSNNTSDFFNLIKDLVSEGVEYHFDSRTDNRVLGLASRIKEVYEKEKES